MTSAEAVRLIAMLGAYYSREIGEDTAGLWAQSLVEFEVQDGMEAVHILGAGGRFLPSLADLTDTIRECRNDRLLAARSALPVASDGRGVTLGAFLRDNPDMAERVKALDDVPEKTGPAGAAVRDALAKILEAGL